jgi:hypothetical protein
MPSVFWLLHWAASLPFFSLSLGIPILRPDDFEIEPINNLTMVSKCSHDRKSHGLSL